MADEQTEPERTEPAPTAREAAAPGRDPRATQQPPPHRDTAHVPSAATVQGVNELTAHWARLTLHDAAAGSAGTVFSAAGLWPLLAGLAAGGDTAVQRELAAPLGVDPQHAARLACDLIPLLNGTEGIAAALGLWTREEVQPEPEWVAALPYGTHGDLTGHPEQDRARLDEWAAAHTDGRIPGMPVQLAPGTLLVLASALAVRTNWTTPFHAAPGPLPITGGPWADREVGQLFRGGGDPADLDVADTPEGALTRLTVHGDTGVDVQLLLGAPDMAPATVLATGVTLPATARWLVSGGQLPYGEPGPGVTVTDTASTSSDPVLAATLPPFTVSATHDLLAEPAQFGLATASQRDAPAGHFPGVSRTVPLAVSSAQQSVTAGFTAEGFFAAAVTAVAMVRAVAAPRERAQLVSVRYDRPFGFAAVHRASGLVLAAGWVSDPDPPPQSPAGR